MEQHFQRNEQFWKVNDKGEILLINTLTENRHFNGDTHIFYPNGKTFNQEGATVISEDKFNQARKEHIKRLENF